jgi:hypothetical protein
MDALFTSRSSRPRQAVIHGEVDMRDNTQNVKIPSFVINCWDMDIEATEKFMLDEWDIVLDIKAELGL